MKNFSCNEQNIKSHLTWSQRGTIWLGVGFRNAGNVFLEIFGLVWKTQLKIVGVVTTKAAASPIATGAVEGSEIEKAKLSHV